MTLHRFDGPSGHGQPAEGHRDSGGGVVQRGSAVRFVVGVLLMVVAMVVTVAGFFRLARVLESGGYGTSAQRDALIVLGVGGALFATGIATVIWDVSQRYEKH